MTSAKEMIGHSEAQAAIERARMRWAAEKAVSRLDTAADMHWVLRQAGDDYTLAEKYLEIWDRGTELGVNPIYLIGASNCAIQLIHDRCADRVQPLRLAMYVALEWVP